MTDWNELGLVVPTPALDVVRESASYEAFVQIARTQMAPADACSLCTAALADGQLGVCPPCWLRTKDGRAAPTAA